MCFLLLTDTFNTIINSSMSVLLEASEAKYGGVHHVAEKPQKSLFSHNSHA